MYLVFSFLEFEFVRVTEMIYNYIIQNAWKQNFDFHPRWYFMIDFQLIYFEEKPLEISNYFKVDEDDHLEPF